MTAPRWKQTDRNGNQVGQPHRTEPKDLDWVANQTSQERKSASRPLPATQPPPTGTTEQMLVYVLIEGLYPQLIYFAKTAREYGDWIANRAARWLIDRKPALMIGLFRLTSELTNDAEDIIGPCPNRPSSASSASPTAPTSPGCAAPLSCAERSRVTLSSRTRIAKLSRPGSRRNSASAAGDQGWFAGFHRRFAGGEQRTTACAAAARSLRRSRRRHPF